VAFRWKERVLFFQLFGRDNTNMSGFVYKHIPKEATFSRESTRSSSEENEERSDVTLPLQRDSDLSPRLATAATTKREPVLSPRGHAQTGIPNGTLYGRSTNAVLPMGTRNFVIPAIKEEVEQERSINRMRSSSKGEHRVAKRANSVPLQILDTNANFQGVHKTKYPAHTNKPAVQSKGAFMVDGKRVSPMGADAVAAFSRRPLKKRFSTPLVPRKWQTGNSNTNLNYLTLPVHGTKPSPSPYGHYSYAQGVSRHHLTETGEKKLMAQPLMDTPDSGLLSLASVAAARALSNQKATSTVARMPSDWTPFAGAFHEPSNEDISPVRDSPFQSLSPPVNAAAYVANRQPTPRPARVHSSVPTVHSSMSVVQAGSRQRLHPSLMASKVPGSLGALNHPYTALRPQKYGFDFIKAPALTGKPCRCRSTRCLKLYCECFNAGLLCDPKLCKCQDCANTSQHNEDRGERHLAILKILNKKPGAFSGQIRRRLGKGCKCTKGR